LAEALIEVGQPDASGCPTCASDRPRDQFAGFNDHLDGWSTDSG
jgi:hypothetical protein